MSRVGKRPIKVATGVKVAFHAPNVEVSGKGGNLKKVLPPAIKVEVKGDEVHVVNTGGTQAASLHGLTRTLISNMIVGVSQGYSRDLELQGVGYRAQAQGSKLTLQLG